MKLLRAVNFLDEFSPHGAERPDRDLPDLPDLPDPPDLTDLALAERPALKLVKPDPAFGRRSEPVDIPAVSQPSDVDLPGLENHAAQPGLETGDQSFEPENEVDIALEGEFESTWPTEPDAPADQNCRPADVGDDREFERGLSVLGDQVSDQVAALQSRLLTALSGAFQQLGIDHADRRVDRELAELVQRFCQDGAQITIAGPERILERLKVSLDPGALRIDWHIQEASEVHIEVDDIVIETCIGEWLAQLGQHAS